MRAVVRFVRWLRSRSPLYQTRWSLGTVVPFLERHLVVAARREAHGVAEPAADAVGRSGRCAAVPAWQRRVPAALGRAAFGAHGLHLVTADLHGRGPVMRRACLPFVTVVSLLLTVAPQRPAAGQIRPLGQNPGDETPPLVELMAPVGDVTVQYPLITIGWCDGQTALDAASRSIRVNGQLRTSSFSYTAGGWGGDCAGDDATSSTTTVALNVGSNTIRARICDVWQNCTTREWIVNRAVAGPPVVTLKNQNGDHQDRSLCLVTDGGEAGAVQCGDLLVTHALPAYRTLGRDRALTLVYNSHTSTPRPVVAAWASRGAGVAMPDSVYAELTVNGQIRASAWYDAWSGVAQIALAFQAHDLSTGLYPFALLIRHVYAAGAYDTTASGTLIVVNRRTSPLGAGWWVGGVEQLRVQSGNRLLWIGGDGSAVVYDSTSAGVWVRTPGTFRDTIIRDGGTYARRLRHGVTVTFDNLGRHIQTTSRTGQTTSFTWSATSDTLTTVVVPPAGQPRTTYSFSYPGHVFGGITDPVGRVLGATITNGLLSDLQDPDGVTVHFDYDAQSRLVRRRNRLGVSTEYAYANDVRLTKVDAPNGMVALAAWDEKGLAVGHPNPGRRSAVDTGAVYTLIDGPRSIPDLSRIWVDRWGAPTRVTDPLGATTRYMREPGGTVPALVTGITYPNGRIVRMSWDDRGNLLQQRDSTLHLVNGQPTAVTTYTYKAPTTPDAPDTIIDPEQVRTSFTYTSAGVLSSAKAPNGHVTSFVPIASGPLAGLLQAVVEPGVPTWDSAGRTEAVRTLRTAFGRNALGNVTSDTVGVWGGSQYLGGARSVRRYDRDSTQQVVTAWDAGNHRVDLVYDLLNRLLESRVHVTGDSAYGTGFLTTRRTYATAGHWEDSLIDPRHVTFRTRYDAAGRVVARYDDYDLADSTFYQPGGLVDSVRSRVGLTIRYTYDAAGRTRAVRWPGRDMSPADSVVNTYDSLLGVLKTAIAGGRKVERTYYPNGLLRSEVQSALNGAFPNTHVYGYDRAGRRTWYRTGTPGSVTQSDSVWYGYHATHGTLSTIGVRWRGGQTEQVQLAWDALERRDGMTYPNGAQVTFAYDYDGMVRRICGTHAGGPTNQDVFDFTYLHEWVDADRMIRRTTRFSSDMAGCSWNNVTRFDENNVFDSRHQLTLQFDEGMAESFAYDSSGNRVRRREYQPGSPGTPLEDEIYVIDSLHNRLRERLFHDELPDSIGRRYVYDDDGNLLTEQPFCPGCAPDSTFGRRDYWYDGLGRTKGTNEYRCQANREQDCQALQFVWNPHACTYDPLGRNVTACDSDYFGYGLGFDGENVTRTDWDQAQTGWTFVHAPGTDSPLMSRRGDYSFTVYSVTDGTGRELAIGYADGSDFASEGLWAQGPRLAGAAANGTGFGIQRYRNPEMYKLSFFRNRFYDQATGRWTQEDPIGHAGGINLYGYVGNNPVAYTDPFGLCPIPPSSCLGRQGADLGVGSVPVASTLHDAVTAVTGHNIVTGEDVGLGGRALAAAGALTPVSGGQLRGAGRILGQLVERLGRPLADAIQNGVRRVEFQLGDGAKLVFRGPETHALSAGGPQVRHYNVEVHEPTGAPGRFRRTENTHIDEEGRVIRP